MVNPALVRRKMGLILEDLERLVEYRSFSLADMVGDYRRLAVVERLLERIISRAIDVNEHFIAELATGTEAVRLDYRATFMKLADFGVYAPAFAQEIAKSAGLRNVLVHDYNDMDHSLLHGSIGTCLTQYRDYCRFVLDFIAKK